MSEKEKMLRGEFYNSRDEELIKVYHKARNLLDIFNNCKSNEMVKRGKTLENLLGFKGKGVWIEKPFYCDYGENIYIGENTFINFNCTLLDCNKIKIGKNGLIGPNVQIYTASHPLDSYERVGNIENGGPYRTYANPVSIGDNVWIGGNSCILPGVTIGDNCVIGAGSVVTKSIPDNCVVAGNPCKVIKSIGGKND
ncbi:sugar O-acetyltransferase [Clostridium rectalis]|uniref:sugar O-acetyltransferase n=1 Tax=Clostridium rectalis TaxID=2040295 RepID=UPI000F63CACD|nr:sugar O-acetyltransferase [Clostridium rectalis]